MDSLPAVLAPQDLHPALWLGHQLGRARDDGLPSGFAALDAQLPGGGWPRRALTELLLPHPGSCASSSAKPLATPSPRVRPSWWPSHSAGCRSCGARTAERPTGMGSI